MKETLEKLLAGPVSGEALAHELGITRSAVHKRIEALRAAGVEIDALAGRGYRLRRPIELFDRDAILATLSPSARAELAELHLAFETDSTQSRALAAAAPTKGCALWLAERQTAGQGRRGRAWASPLAAHVCLSVARRFDLGFALLSGLSLAVGVLVAEALQAAGFDDVRLKWPNDLVVGGRKLGGILIQLRGEAMGPCEAVIGLGLNVRMPSSSGELIDQPWCDLAGLTKDEVSRQRVLVAVLDRLLPGLAVYEREGFPAFLRRWQALDSLHGHRVRVIDGRDSVEGLALGIAEDGALRVQLPEGEGRYHGGEVSVRSE
ncbi:biotin--[acetyl-CoA-carboxylase] ligase [Arenimonas sp.]|uniref:biotin--[acetyl-CoA-carboxylase] ligase n=1 Tax=Arenimonas sp. TaxID=1872635 RepID=UPI0039E60726